MRSLQCIALLLITGAWQLDPLKALFVRVGLYWDALVERDKATALEFVEPASRNNFILRRESIMQEWTLQSIEMKSESRARVTVLVDREINGIVFGKAGFSEDWILQGPQWMVSVPKVDQTEVFKQLTRNAENSDPEPLSGEVRVVPPDLKIWFLSPRQDGMVRVRNERQAVLSVTSIEYDASLFRLVAAPEVLQSGEQAELRIEYLGDEIKKNLPGKLVLNLDYGGQPEAIEIEVLYNFFSDSSRGLFGLTKEEADKLPRGAVPRPVLKFPGQQKPPQKP